MLNANRIADINRAKLSIVKLTRIKLDNTMILQYGTVFVDCKIISNQEL